MPIYKVTIKGREKQLLVSAESRAKAKDMVVDATTLSADETAEALVKGEKVWNGTDPLPEDGVVRYLEFFRAEADFGPASAVVIAGLDERFTEETGLPVPEEYREE